MIRRTPRSTLTVTLFPYTTLFRSILLHLCWRAARVGGFSGGRGAEEIRIMRGLPYPLHIAPFVIVEICAQKDVVGEAVVIGFQFPLPLGWNAPLPLHAARCTCGSSDRKSTRLNSSP